MVDIVIETSRTEEPLSNFAADVASARSKFSQDDWCFSLSTVAGLVAKLQELSTEVPMYVYTGRTGCSCCSQENFISGPYEDAASVLFAVRNSHDIKEVASQHSKNGDYAIYKLPALPVCDGRFIVNNTVFTGLGDTKQIDSGYLSGPALVYDPHLSSAQIETYFDLRPGQQLTCKRTNKIREVLSVSTTLITYANVGSVEAMGQCQRSRLLTEFSVIPSSDITDEVLGEKHAV